MTRRQNLAAAAASFAIAIAAAAGRPRRPRRRRRDGPDAADGGRRNGHGRARGDAREMHALCHRMMMVMYELSVEGVALVNVVLGAEALVR